jgi:Lipocalin-like domain
LSARRKKKFASNHRLESTSEENKFVVQGAIAYYGTYIVNETDHTLIFHIERCTFPNWDGTDQKRSVTITGDEITGCIGRREGRAGMETGKISAQPKALLISGKKRTPPYVAR